jgi:hypothetical protein
LSAWLTRGCGFPSSSVGLDAEDVPAHPLLQDGELVPSEANPFDPLPEVLALAYDVARCGGEGSTFLKVESGQMEAALPCHRPGGGTPRGVDVLQLLAPLFRQRAGQRLHRQASARHCAISMALRAPALAFLRKVLTRCPGGWRRGGTRRWPCSLAHPRAAARPSSQAVS